MTPTRCYLCHSRNVGPLPFHMPDAVTSPLTGQVFVTGTWVRCRDCGSDTNGVEYRATNYTPELADGHAANGGGPEAQEQHLSYNCDLFSRWAGTLPDQTFLDVGCCDGAGLRAMAKRGWAVHGFDVFPPPYMGVHITVSPVFSRWLFPRRYSAIMCREVLEHVVYPEMLTRELTAACLPGGMVQLQTPAPLDTLTVAHVYQEPHLFIPSPKWIGSVVADMGVEVVERLDWDGGQLWQWRCP